MAKAEADFRSLDLGEHEVAPPMVDFRTTEEGRKSVWGPCAPSGEVGSVVEGQSDGQTNRNHRAVCIGNRRYIALATIVAEPRVMPERNVFSSVASSRFKSCLSRDVKLASLRWRAHCVKVTCNEFSKI